MKDLPRCVVVLMVLLAMVGCSAGADETPSSSGAGSDVSQSDSTGGGDEQPMDSPAGVVVAIEPSDPTVAVNKAWTLAGTLSHIPDGQKEADILQNVDGNQVFSQDSTTVTVE